MSGIVRVFKRRSTAPASADSKAKSLQPASNFRAAPEPKGAEAAKEWLRSQDISNVLQARDEADLTRHLIKSNSLPLTKTKKRPAPIKTDIPYRGSAFAGPSSEGRKSRRSSLIQALGGNPSEDKGPGSPSKSPFKALGKKIIGQASRPLTPKKSPAAPRITKDQISHPLLDLPALSPRRVRDERGAGFADFRESWYGPDDKEKGKGKVRPATEVKARKVTFEEVGEPSCSGALRVAEEPSQVATEHGLLITEGPALSLSAVVVTCSIEPVACPCETGSESGTSSDNSSEYSDHDREGEFNAFAQAFSWADEPLEEVRARDISVRPPSRHGESVPASQSPDSPRVPQQSVFKSWVASHTPAPQSDLPSIAEEENTEEDAQSSPGGIIQPWDIPPYTQFSVAGQHLTRFVADQLDLSHLTNKQLADKLLLSPALKDYTQNVVITVEQLPDVARLREVFELHGEALTLLDIINSVTWLSSLSTADFEAAEAAQQAKEAKKASMKRVLRPTLWREHVSLTCDGTTPCSCPRTLRRQPIPGWKSPRMTSILSREIFPVVPVVSSEQTAAVQEEEDLYTADDLFEQPGEVPVSPLGSDATIVAEESAVSPLESQINSAAEADSEDGAFDLERYVSP